jgi:rubrerythrin
VRLLCCGAMTDKTGALRTREAEKQTTWRCLTCTFEVVNTILPRKCPRCGASRVKFLEVGATAEADE